MCRSMRKERMMADTPTYWRFSKEDVAKFGEALRLLGGVPVAPRALLIEDAERARRIIEIAADQLEDEDCSKIADALRWLLRAAVGEGEE